MKLANHFRGLRRSGEVRDELRNHLDQAGGIVASFETILANHFFKIVPAITWKL